MAYQVNKYNGSFLTSVADGTVDLSTDIKFVGKNYAGYGQIQNENFLFLLENFSGASQPNKPIVGQLWFDTNDRKIKVFDGSRFKLVGGATASATAPTGLTAGEFWFDAQARQLYCWTGLEFSLIGPETSTVLGETSVTSQIVRDTAGNLQTIAQIKVGSQEGDPSTIAIFSKQTFNLDLVNYNIPGFGRINKGITLADTNNAQGVTSISSGTSLWGTATSARSIIDTNTGTPYTIDQIVKTDDPTFPSLVKMVEGFDLGPVLTPTFKVFRDNSDIVLESQPSITNVKFKLRLSELDLRTIVNIGSSSITPGITNEYSLGSSLLKWNQIFANNFIGDIAGNVIGNVSGNVSGNLTGNVTGNVTGNLTGNVTGILFGTATNALNASTLNDAVSATAPTPFTIPIRDGSGNIEAIRLIGTADKANRMRIDNSAVDSDPNFKSAKTSPEANTIAARDSAGDLYATVFNGAATSVLSGDLAEKYLPDNEYPPGTVVKIGGEKEITASTLNDVAIGVISTSPGYMMNNSLEGGVYVALKGRVPVYVIGPVIKGQKLVPSDQGYAVAVNNMPYNYFAVALENNTSDGVKLIEAVIL